MIKTRSN